MAYITDTIPKEDQAKCFARVNMCISIAFTFGPVVGGAVPFIMRLYGVSIRVQFITCCAVGALFGLLSFVISFFRLNNPQTSEETRREEVVVSIEECGVEKPSSLRLLPIYLCNFINATIFTITLTIFAKFLEDFETRIFDFGAAEIFPTLLFIAGLTGVVSQTFVINSLINLFGEGWSIRLGYSLSTIALGIIITFPQSFAAWFGSIILLYIGHNLLQTTFPILYRKNSTPQTRGRIMGTGQSMEAMNRIIMPLAGSFLYSLNRYLPFIGSMGILTFGMIVSFMISNNPQ